MVFAFTAEVIPEVWVLVFALMTAASDVVAMPTRVSVFEFTAEVIPAVCALVLAFTALATDDDAVVIAEASDVEALPTMVLVFVLTAEVIPAVCALVFALMTDARDDDAVVTSESVARDPEVRPADVRVRVVAAHTSEATEASEVSVLAE